MSEDAHGKQFEQDHPAPDVVYRTGDKVPLAFAPWGCITTALEVIETIHDGIYTVEIRRK